MIPSTRFLVLLALGLVPAAAARWWAPLGPVAAAWDGALLLLLALDASRGARRDWIAVERVLPARLCVGVENVVTLQVRSFAPVPLRVDLVDGWTADFDVAPAERAAVLPAWGRAELVFRVVPRSRGEFPLRPVHVRLRSRLGLCRRRVEAGEPGSVRVHPDLRALRRWELLSRRRLLQTQGYRAVRRIGDGREFDQLREYSPDDDFRSIDWKATARRARPITRVFDTERGQNVLILIDAGRLMGASSGGITKLDHAVNAALMLGHVATRHHDRVGLVVFSGDVERVALPRPGRGAMTRLMDAVADLRPRPTFSNYRAAVETVALRMRRRSLVVLFTDISDPDSARDLTRYVPLLRPAHLPVCVAFRDPGVDRLAQEPPATREAMYDHAAAIELVQEWRGLLGRLRKDGVAIVDVAPEEAAVAAVNKFLELKKRQAI